MFVYRVLAIAFLQLYFVEEISGIIGVTLGVFSGVPDPHWLVEPNQALQILYKKARGDGVLLGVDAMPSRLGFRGLIIQEDKDEVLVLGPKTVELQEQLFLTMPKNLIPNKVYSRVLREIKSGSILPVEERRKRFAPAFNAAPWGGAARKKNNCYNYATIRLTNTFAQPGRGSGAIYAAITKARIQAAAVRDGLTVVANGNTPGGNNVHVVALVVEDCVDFHWYLKNNDNRWTHKPGKTRVTRYDNSNNLINNPAACDMNGYEFVTYMTVNSNNAQIN